MFEGGENSLFGNGKNFIDVFIRVGLILFVICDMDYCVIVREKRGGVFINKIS